MNYLNHKIESWGSSLAGLGINFGITWVVGSVAGRGMRRDLGAARDLAAITAFDDVRTNDLKELIQRLQSPIQIPEEKLEQIIGNY